MKSEIFLALPILATALNLLLDVAFLAHHTKAQLEPVVPQGIVADRCLGITGEDCNNLDSVLLGDASQDVPEDSDLAEDKDADDPMLQQMPRYDFKAYVRADVSTFYGEEPVSRTEQTPAFNGMAGKFVNMSPRQLSLYWVGPNYHVFTGDVHPWSSSGTACYPTHEFIFSEPNDPDKVVCSFTVTPGTSTYYCDPYSNNVPGDPAHGIYVPIDGPLSLDSLSPQDKEHYGAHVFNLEFGAAYKNFTGGSEWLSMYPRNRPRHKIWRADYYGQEHHVTTTETHFVVDPPKEEMYRLSIPEMRESELQEYRKPGVMNMTIKALSCAPRAFEIRNFLSDAEVDHILHVINTKNLERSTTAGHKSETRTSRTTWIPRFTDPILNAVIRRAADALRLDEALLRHRVEGEYDELPNKAPLNEDLQIVHYDRGQQYTAHHDFSFPLAGQPESPTRSINLCMYLNDVEAGGETSFPRWRNGETTGALNVKPEKGKAMIFFMTTPDGNLDDLTQHAALPVLKGEKWFANLWIHDPIRL